MEQHQIYQSQEVLTDQMNHPLYNFSLSSEADIIVIGDYEPLESIRESLEAGRIDTFHLIDDEWIPIGPVLKGTRSYQRLGEQVFLSSDASTLAASSKSIDGFDEVITFLHNNNTWIEFGESVSGRNPSLSADGKVLSVTSSNFGQVYVRTREGWEPIGQGLTNSDSGTISGNGQFTIKSFNSGKKGSLRIFKGESDN